MKSILSSHPTFCTPQQVCDADECVQAKLQNEMAIKKKGKKLLGVHRVSES